MRHDDVYRDVARLHAENIDQGFLPKLGIPFLSLLYEAIDATECSTLIVKIHKGRVVGFVAGTQSMRPIYLNLIRRWPRLIWCLLPSALSPRKLWKIFEVLLFSRKSSSIPQMPRAELLSIAVDSAFRGHGYARCLYRNLVHFFSTRGADSFRIVVGESLEAAHRFYTQMGAIAVGNIQVHAGANSRVYVHRCPPKAGGLVDSTHEN